MAFLVYLRRSLPPCANKHLQQTCVIAKSNEPLAKNSAKDTMRFTLQRIKQTMLTIIYSMYLSISVRGAGVVGCIPLSGLPATLPLVHEGAERLLPDKRSVTRRSHVDVSYKIVLVLEDIKSSTAFAVDTTRVELNDIRAHTVNTALRLYYKRTHLFFCSSSVSKYRLSSPSSTASGSASPSSSPSAPSPAAVLMIVASVEFFTKTK